MATLFTNFEKSFEKKMCFSRKIACISLFIFVPCLLKAQRARGESFLTLIEKGVTHKLLSLSHDKMSELEANLLNALLEIDAKKATNVYQRIIDLYPDSKYALFCKKRLDDFLKAMALRPLEFERRDVLPSKSKEDLITTETALKTLFIGKTEGEKTKKGSGIYVVQVGSFLSRQGASLFIKSIASLGDFVVESVQAKDSEHMLYKVWTRERFDTYEDAKVFGEQIDQDYFIVTIND